MGAGNAAGGGSNRYEPPKKKNPVVQFIKGGGFVGSLVTGITKAIKTTKTKSKQNTMDYEGQAAGVTPMKNPSVFSGGEGSNNNNYQSAPVIIKKNIGGNTIQTTAPTKAEVSQSETANADASALKVKKKGRSMTMLTGSKGVRGMASNYSLGKKSLLGQV